LRYATIRVVLTAGLGVFFALKAPDLLHIDPRYGALGLTGSAGVAGWIEFALLRRGIGARIGLCHLPKGLLPRLWGAAVVATAVGLGAKLTLPPLHPIVRAAIVLGLFGATYLAATLALGVPEASAATARLRRLLRR
jgi:putative peptidoglycan lipid II flippase